MKKREEIDLSPVTFTVPALSEAQIQAFRNATRTEHAALVPLTFPTCFRKAEFDFLERFEVDMRDLLHVDQEYVYHSPFQVGDVLTVSTKVGDAKERRGMLFVKLYTDISQGSQLRITSNTSFVVKVGA